MKKIIVLMCLILLGGMMYAHGNTYPIYLSKNGKYFIIRKSQKTGKEYRQYLPQVAQKLEETKNKKQ